MPDEKFLAIGLMSGTSMDGVDAAIIETDGEAVTWTGPSTTVPYDDDTRAELRAAQGIDPSVQSFANDLEDRLTDIHVEAVLSLLSKVERGDERFSASDVGVIGFHGHTVLHRPDLGVTRQIGNGALLARKTGINVVADLRQNDVAHGGEGAPLAPIYHRARATDVDRPLAVLNLGGVGNVTWIGSGKGKVDGDLVAFDTGPGNALLDDWVRHQTGAAMDRNGALAAQGKVHHRALKTLLAYAYFDRLPPKSLDRDEFSMTPVENMTVADGAATLAAFTIESVALAARFFPAPVGRWLVTGGGRHNPVLMTGLRRKLGVPVEPVEAVGWNGDSLEAEAFAYMAVRSLNNKVLSYPKTTGVAEAVTGGRVYYANA